MRVTSEVHGVKVVDGADDGLKERGDEFARGGEGMKVRPREELREDVVVKDVDKGNRGEVVFGNEVGVANSENREGGAVQEIGGAWQRREGGELRELSHGRKEGGEVINVWRRRCI